MLIIGTMSTRNWHSINESNVAGERDALAFIRERFPDREPYRAWSNFEFIADDGSVNEVDTLLFTPQGFFFALATRIFWPSTSLWKTRSAASASIWFVPRRIRNSG